MLSRVAALPCVLLAGCTLSFSDEAEQVAEARQRLLQCPARQLQVSAVELPYQVSGRDLPRLELGDDPAQHLSNQLGAAYAALSNVHPRFDAAPTVAARLGRDLPWNLRLHRCADDGDARFTVAAVLSGADELGVVAALGALDGTRAVLDEPGQPWVPISALADPLGTSSPGGLLGVYGRMIIDDWDAPEPRLLIGAGFPRARIEVLVAEPVAAFFTDRLVADDSTFARELDRDGDLTVSPAELIVNSVYQGILGADLEVTPDLPDGGVSLVLPVIASPR